VRSARCGTFQRRGRRSAPYGYVELAGVGVRGAGLLDVLAHRAPAKPTIGPGEMDRVDARRAREPAQIDRLGVALAHALGSPRDPRRLGPRSLARRRADVVARLEEERLSVRSSGAS
jgi:hypothetical protein